MSPFDELTKTPLANQYLGLDVQGDNIPMKTRPPLVSTVTEWPETVTPKVAKMGDTKSARPTNRLRSNIDTSWEESWVGNDRFRYGTTGIYTFQFRVSAQGAAGATPLGCTSLPLIPRISKSGKLDAALQIFFFFGRGL